MILVVRGHGSVLVRRSGGRAVRQSVAVRAMTPSGRAPPYTEVRALEDCRGWRASDTFSELSLFHKGTSPDSPQVLVCLSSGTTT